MVEQEGIVRGLRGQECWIDICSQDSCSGCLHGCATNFFSPDKTPLALKLPKPAGIHLLPGDRVILGIRERSLLLASLKAYVCPLLSFFAGAVLAAWLAKSANLMPVDIAAMGGAVLGSTIYFRRLKHRGLRETDPSQLIILRRL